MATDQYDTRESVAALAEPDPEYVELTKQNAIPQIDWHDISAIRQLTDSLATQSYDLFKTPDVTESPRKIPMRDGFESEIYVITPKTPSSSGSPLIVLVYGGGFVTGDSRQMIPTARAFASLYGATVVCAQYRLAPEHKFPASQNDVWDTLLWAAANASSLGADPAKGFVLGGISAGGCLSAALSQRWVSEKQSPPLTGIWLSIPLIVPDANNPPKGYENLFFSREQNAKADILSKEAVDAIEGFLQPDRSSALYSPLNAENPHAGLPPVYIQVNGLDPLRDDGLVYEKILKKNGVETRLDVYPGLPHAHWAFVPLPEKSMGVNVDIAEGMAWLLKTSVPKREAVVKLFTPTA